MTDVLRFDERDYRDRDIREENIFTRNIVHFEITMLVRLACSVSFKIIPSSTLCLIIVQNHKRVVNQNKAF